MGLTERMCACGHGITSHEWEAAGLRVGGCLHCGCRKFERAKTAPKDWANDLEQVRLESRGDLRSLNLKIDKLEATIKAVGANVDDQLGEVARRMGWGTEGDHRQIEDRGSWCRETLAIHIYNRRMAWVQKVVGGCLKSMAVGHSLTLHRPFAYICNEAKEDYRKEADAILEIVGGKSSEAPTRVGRMPASVFVRLTPEAEEVYRDHVKRDPDAFMACSDCWRKAEAGEPKNGWTHGVCSACGTLYKTDSVWYASTSERLALTAMVEEEEARKAGRGE